MPLPLLAVPLLVAGGGAAGSVAIGYGLSKASGTEYSQRDMVGDIILGAIPGVAFAKGVGSVGYRLHKGRKIIRGYNPGVTQHSVSPIATRLGVGQSVTSNISVKEARRNVYIYAAMGGAPALRAIGYEAAVNRMLDAAYRESERTSQPSTETQRRNSSRNVGRRGARTNQSRKSRRVARVGARCPNGYRYNAKLKACILK